MALTVTAAVVGTSTPRAVQVVVSGLIAGEDYTVTGSWSGGSWPVRAGTGVAKGSQLVLADVATPVNTPITYTAEHAGVVASSDSVRVDYGGKFVAQSLDGRDYAEFGWSDNGDPRTQARRTAVFRIPGRERALVRYDVPGGESGDLVVTTRGPQTRALQGLLAPGGPLLLRTDGNVRDLDAVSFIQPTSATRVLTGEGIQSTNARQWSIGFELIDDPEPNTVVALSTWDDFDAVYAGLTWANFDAEWAGLTWADFDVHDWATRGA